MKKLLSVLLAVLMVLTILPVTAFAAGGTGHQIAVKIYKVVLDDSMYLGYQNPQFVTTTTVICQDETAHSGYNHCVNLKNFYPKNFGLSDANADWTGWSFDSSFDKNSVNGPFYSWTREQVNATANVTGSEPYPCSKNFYLVYKNPNPQPAAPSAADVQALLKVEIDCENDEAEHHDKTYNLIAGTFDIGKVSGSSTAGYKVDITVYSASYIAAYDEYTGATHTLEDDEPASKTVTLTYNSSKKWTSPDSEVEFDVECDTPDAPDLPDADELKKLFNVSVDCVNEEVEHEKKTYNLIAGSYTFGTMTGSYSTGYTVDVSVSADKYLQQYGTDMGETHTLAATSTSPKKVTLTWSKETAAWTTATKEVAFEAECETPDPEVPNADELKKLFNVSVDCVNEDVEHDKKTYNLIAGSYSVGSKTGSYSTGYTVEVSVSADKYIQQYGTDMGETHTLASTSTSPKKVTLTWTKDTAAWTTATKAVAFEAECETPEPPAKPTETELKNILGDSAVVVYCSGNPYVSHNSKLYGLLAGSYTLGNVEGTPKDGYTLKLTLKPQVFVDQYSTDLGSTHKMNGTIPAEKLVFTLTYGANGWTLNLNPPILAIPVICAEGPAAPTADELSRIFDGNIQMTCVNEDVEHDQMSFALLEGSYSVGKVEGSLEDGFTVKITVSPASYITAYDKEIGGTHKLSPSTQGSAVIVLRCSAIAEFSLSDNNGLVWVPEDEDALPISWTVTCAEDKPTEPNRRPMDTSKPIPSGSLAKPADDANPNTGAYNHSGSFAVLTLAVGAAAACLTVCGRKGRKQEK